MNTKAKNQTAAKNVLTHQQMIDALTNANALYIARCKQKQKNPVVNKSGVSGDIATALSLVKDFSDVHLSEVAKMGLNDTVLNCLRDASNIKQTKRIMQALLFTLTENGNYLQASAKAWFLGYVGIIAAGAKTVEGVKYCMSGKGNENTSDQLKSIEKANKILRAFKAIGAGSVSAQYSVSFGQGGVATALQCAKKDTRNGMPIANPDSPVIAKLDSIIKKATDGYIELIAAQSSSKSRK